MSTAIASSKKVIHLENKLKSRRGKGILQRLGIPHHEYWPWWLLVIPVWPLWLWYGLRLKCATWFTTVNPGFEDGGFMGESKKSIQDIIPADLQPKVYYITASNPFNKIKVENDLDFPFIAKPDIGGRGRKVQIINNEEEFVAYNNNIGEDYMIQEMIQAPIELGVFFTRIPSDDNGIVTSITSKGFLSVQGDGALSIRNLMKLDERASSQIERIAKNIDLERIPKLNENVLLEPIGNHCRGTKFINESHRINEELHQVFTDISKRIEGFYYGRFDIRVPSWEDLYLGKNISILELNGLTSDVTHIFDPEYRLRDVFKTQYKHIKIAYKIANVNLKQGAKATPVLELAKKSFAALKMM